MTTEVMLMNLQAVALGADSAVTLSGGAASMSQTGIDKIFIINEAAPVAAMIYGGARIAGLPFKPVFDRFRAICGPDPKSMTDYVAALTTFLANIADDATLGADPEAEQDTFAFYVRAFVADYMMWLRRVGWKPKTAVTSDQAVEALTRLRAGIMLHVPDGAAADSAPVPKPRMDAPARLDAFVSTYLPRFLKAEMADLFEGAAFPAPQVEPLKKLLVDSILVEWLPVHALNHVTGLVLAGFGAGRAAPSSVEFTFIGAFGGVLKGTLATSQPQAGKRNAIVQTFAQDDMTRAFVFGSTFDFAFDTVDRTQNILLSALSDVLDHIAASDKKLAQSLHNPLMQIALQAPNMGVDYATNNRLEQVVPKLWPLIGAANSMVLAGFAQKMMEFPILEHELLKDESVARPVILLTMEQGRFQFLKDGVRI